jgi:hypothetical protein
MTNIFDKLHQFDPNDPEPLESLIPPKIFYLAMHLHNLIYIRAFYESIGMQPPVWTKGEMERSQGHLLRQLDLEQGQGGKFRKEERHETRQDRDEERGVESRTQVHPGTFRRRG